MKTKRKGKKGGGPIPPDDVPSSVPQLLREGALAETSEGEAMLRTQIYLSKAEHEFVQRESLRRNVPMAAVIRQFIDEKMEAPERAWLNNPMLAPSAEDPSWQGHEDGALNHDHYIYGAPKRFVKNHGQWVDAPALPEDYYDNPASRAAYDAKLPKVK